MDWREAGVVWRVVRGRGRVVVLKRCWARARERPEEEGEQRMKFAMLWCISTGDGTIQYLVGAEVRKALTSRRRKRTTALGLLHPNRNIVSASIVRSQEVI